MEVGWKVEEKRNKESIHLHVLPHINSHIYVGTNTYMYGHRHTFAQGDMSQVTHIQLYMNMCVHRDMYMQILIYSHTHIYT